MEQNNQSIPQEDTDIFDTTKDEEELNAYTAELEQARASIEADFADYAAGKIDASLEDMFFNDRVGFFKTILNMQNEFLESNVNPKEEKIRSLQRSINEKTQFKALEQAKNEFLRANPNVDLNELMDFFANDLPPRITKELEPLFPSVQFFQKVADLMNSEKSETALPQQLNGQNIDAHSTNDDSLPFGR